MKQFGFMPYDDPYGVNGNLPEVPVNDDDDVQNTIDDSIATGCVYGASLLVVILVAVVVTVCISLFSSCSPRVIENTIVKHDTTFVQKLQRDSIYVHDSVYVAETHWGDTVRIVTDRWHTAWRDRWVHDTAYVSRTDTIYRADVKMVEKPLTSWQSFQLWLGRLALLAIALTLAVIIIRKVFFHS